MATFTIDLLTGNIYLFSGDFGSGTGSTPTTGSTYPEVETWNDLPLPASDYAGEIYVVLNDSGTWWSGKHDAGMYYSDGIEWKRLGNTPTYFDSTHFRIYDPSSTSKALTFSTSGITAIRNIQFQNLDGTVAYLTDLNAKVDLSLFTGYTALTNTRFVNIESDLYAFSASTLIRLEDVEDEIALTYEELSGLTTAFQAHTGQTGTGSIHFTGHTFTPSGATQINIIGDNVIIYSPTPSGFTTPTTALQLQGTNESVNVNNIQPTGITWTSQLYSGTSLSFTGGSRIYVKANGIYGISYALTVNNESGSAKNIGTIIRKNGDTDITPMSSASFNLNIANDKSTNSMPEYQVDLLNNDYLELMAFRIGYAGVATPVGNGSWIKIKKL